MLVDDFRHAGVSLQSNNLNLLHVGGLPVLVFDLEHVLEVPGRLLVRRLPEDVEIVVLVTACLALLERLPLLDLRQHVMVHDLVRADRDVGGEVGFEDALIVVLIDEEEALLAGLAEE